VSDEAKRAGGNVVEDAFFATGPDARDAGRGFSSFEETERVVRAPAPASSSSSVASSAPGAAGDIPAVGIDVDMDETRPYTPAAGPDETAPFAAALPVDPPDVSIAIPVAKGPIERPRFDPLPYIAAPAAPKKDPPPPDEARVWQARVESLVKEAKARAGDPSAATLWFEAGRIYESALLSLRDAAQHYQEAHKADPTFLPVVHAARRLFAQLGKWQMVVVLIDEELKLPGAPKAALLFEKGRIHETKLGKPDVAQTLYRDALAFDASYAPAVLALTRHLTATNDAKGVIDVLARASQATTQARQKSELLVERARIEDALLKNPTGALAVFEEARALDPQNRATLDALRRLYATTGQEEKLVHILEALSKVALSSAEIVPLELERARIFQRRGEIDRAISALLRAKEHGPADTIVLSELARLLERQERYGELVDVLVALVQHTHDASERVALHADAGRLCESRLKDTDRAVAHYRACIMADPTYQPAISALGRLFARASRYEDLVEVYDVQIRAAQDDAARVPLLFKLAELLADSVGETDQAIEKLATILQISPGYLPALKLISSLYMRQGRWNELVGMYEAELAEIGDRDQAVFLLEKVGSIAENQLDDIPRAIAAYQRMLERVPGYLPALRSLGRLYAKTEQWPKLVQINDEESQIVGDQNQVVSLLYRNGDIYADKIGDLDRAIDCYQKALTLMPNYLPALKALGGIFAKSGRFEDLIAMHRQEADVARTPMQRSHLLFQIAQLCDEKLSDKRRAAQAYRELLEEKPGYYPAIRELSRLALEMGDPAILVEVYQKEIAVLTDPRDRAVMRCRAADVLDRQLDRLDDAVASVESAIEEAPTLLIAHQRLIAYLARKGDERGEAKARERMAEVLPDEGSMVANLRALQEIYLYGLDDPERARTAALRLLALRADDKDALRFAMGCDLRLKEYKAAINHAEALAALEKGSEQATSLHMQVASWKEGHLDPPGDALSNYIEVLANDPENPVALRAVEQAYLVREAWDGLMRLYEMERELARDPVRIADLSMKMGDLAERRLQDVARATREYEAVLRAMPTHIPAIARLKELYEGAGVPDMKLRMLALEAQASRDPAAAIRTLLEVGALQRDQFKNVDAATDAFYQVLARDAHHDEAFRALEALLTTSERFAPLVDVLMARAAVEQKVDARIALLSRAAALLVEKLRRIDEACSVYAEILRLNPADEGALARLAEIRFHQGQWDAAVVAYEALTRVTKDTRLLARAHLALGYISLEQKGDANTAVVELEKSVAADGTNRDARRRFAVALALAGQPARAVQERVQLAGTAPSVEEALAERLALAHLYETALNDFGRAAAELVGALELSSSQEEQRVLYTRIAALYGRAGDTSGYIAFAERQAAALAIKEPKRAADVLLRSARIAATEQKDTDLAIKTARRGLELVPDHAELRALLADLLSSVPSLAVSAVEEHRRVLRQGVARIESIRALFHTWQTQRAFDRAFCAAEILVFLRAATEDEELYFGENRARVKRDSDETIQLAELTSWIVHPQERNVVHEVLALVAPDLGKVDPDDLSHYEIDKKDILTRRSDDPVRRTLVDPVARAFDVQGFDVWRSRKKSNVVAAHHGSPEVLVVGSEIPKLHPMKEQRFLVGRKLMAMKCGHTLVPGYDEQRLRVLLSAIGRAIDKSFTPLVDRVELDALTKKVSSALSRVTKRALAEPVALLAAQGAQLDIAAVVRAMPLTEARGGLVAACDFTAAMQLLGRDAAVRFPPDTDLATVVAKHPPFIDLLNYALSDEYFMARQALRMAIDA